MVSAALKQGKEDQMVTKAIENSALIDLLRAHFAYDNEAVALNDAFAQDMANRDDATIREAVPAFVSRVQAMRLELDTILAGVLVRAKAGAYEPLASPMPPFPSAQASRSKLARWATSSSSPSWSMSN